MLIYVACGMLVPQTGIEPTAPALEAQNFNHWTTRKAPILLFWTNTFYYFFGEKQYLLGVVHIYLMLLCQVLSLALFHFVPGSILFQAPKAQLWLQHLKQSL